MIDLTKDGPGQVLDAKTLLKQWEGHWGDAYDEMREASRFRHNTDGNGQWREEDLAILNAQGRPHLTHNMIHHKVESVVGMNEENRKRFTAQAVGDEDKAVADLVNAVLNSIAAELLQDEIEREAFERQMTIGECDIALSTEPDPENPRWVKLRLTPILATDLAWDPSAERRSAGDAKGVFWSRWMTKAEFLAEYPQRAGEVEKLFAEDSAGSSFPMDPAQQDGNDYLHRRQGRLGNYLDRKRGELRVVHYECRYPRRVTKAVTPIGVQTLDGATAEALRMATPEGVTLHEVWEDTYYWIEFCELEEPLFVGPSPEPFAGFSIKRARCYQDDETAYPYGLVRNLKDPQQEINKSATSSNEQFVLQSKPGYIAEEGAIPDVKKFDEANATGTTALVKTNAISGGMIKERPVAVYSDAVAKRLEVALALLDKISGIYMDAESPVRGQEAATTVLLRDRKALRSMVQPMKNFVHLQQEIALSILAVVANAMPTEQILFLAGDSARWQVDPQGQVVDTERGIPVDIRSLRQMLLDLEPESVDSSEMKSVHELSLLMQLVSVEIPVDPEVIYNRLPLARAEKESLKAYARQLQESQAQAAQQQTQLAEAQLAEEASRKRAEVKIKSMDQLEEQRHNTQSEKIDLILGLVQALTQVDTAEIQAKASAAKAASAGITASA